MSLSINGGAGGLGSTNQLHKTDRRMQLEMARLATAQRINKAGEDPAGLVISEQLRSLLGGISQASDNLEQGVAMLQTADGGLDQMQGLLQRQRDLAIQAGNDAVLDPSQRAVLDRQFQALGRAIDQAAANTRYGNTPLLDGSFRNRALQAGPSAEQTIPVSIASNVTGSPKGFDRQGLGLNGASLSSSAGAADALGRLDTAISAVSQQRGDLGALQANAVESGLRSLGIAQVSLTAAESGIRDTDYAQETANLVRDQILSQAGMATRMQQNLSSSSVLRLLGTGG